MPLARARRLGRGVLAGPVDDPGERGQPDPCPGLLGGALDRLQHALLPAVQQAGRAMDQPAGLGRGELADPLGQDAQLFGVAEPPFFPSVPEGATRRERGPGGPTRARHNASLIST
ncbi:hypothetical protein EDD32_0448 [Georgenia muralis]|uniref:Uncharacterized protein n=1 Tax=Georgenia muralis TaxID=154117 RepID=A0A3N4ZY84_9MICO|nr:hypothetical protein EDD32_0448 [Georgenia muralis]